MFIPSQSKSPRSRFGFISRRRFIVGLGLATGSVCSLGGYTRFFEPHNIEIDRQKIPFLPKGSQSVRIVHLSDLHASPEVSYDYLESVIDKAVALTPDMYCLTGDYITTRLEQFDRYVGILSKLSATAPVYAVTGNHDVFSGINERTKRRVSVRDLLREAKITYLHNRLEELSIRDVRFNLVGLGDYWSYQCKPENVLPIIDKRHPTLVLSHNPDSKVKLENYQWELMLCGHTHGGQLKVPLLGSTPMAPVKDHAYVSGLNEWKGRYIYTTHGVGNLYGMRFNCPPQISYLELTGKMLS